MNFHLLSSSKPFARTILLHLMDAMMIDDIVDKTFARYVILESLVVLVAVLE